MYEFFLGNWYNIPILYIFGLVVTTMIKLCLCHKVKSKEGVVFEIEWSHSDFYSYKVFMYMLTPFLNIYWRYCISEEIKTKVETLDRGEFRYFPSIVSIGAEYCSTVSIKKVVNRETEAKAIARFDKGLSDSIYYLPIVLLLVTFFIAGS